jgi:DinB superfamily
MRDAAADFRVLLDTATSVELRRGSDGTKWTNEQLLFHMLFGYLVVRRLLPLVRFLGRLPDRVSRVFAATLDSGTRPFHVINYLGSLGGARVLGHAGMERLFDRTVNGLAVSLLSADDDDVARGMHFPVGWDPYFRDYMTVVDVHHYATQHYCHHRRQLTLDSVLRPDSAGPRAHCGP